MAGKQAKILSDSHVDAALRAVVKTRYPARNRTILLLSIKAGLRAGEISKLTWPMVCNPDGNIGDTIELYDIAAKKCSGRTIPMHKQIKVALCALRDSDQSEGHLRALLSTSRRQAVYNGYAHLVPAHKICAVENLIGSNNGYACKFFA